MASLSRAWSARTEIRCALADDWLEHSFGPAGSEEEGAQLTSAAAEPMIDLRADASEVVSEACLPQRVLPSRLSRAEIADLAGRLGLSDSALDNHITTHDVDQEEEVPRRFHPHPEATGDSAPPRSQRNHSLRALLERWQQKGAVRPQRLRFPTDWSVLDAALGGGLPRAAVHEFLPGSSAAPVRTLALRLALRSMQTVADEVPRAGTILYPAPEPDLYPPAVQQLGIPLERLLLVRATDPQQAQWVCEQALRSPGVAVLIAELPRLDAARSRRLQLVAEEFGKPGLLLRCEPPREGTFAFSRVRVDCCAEAGRLRQVQVTILKLREALPPPSFRITLPLNGRSYLRGAGPQLRSRTA